MTSVATNVQPTLTPPHDTPDHTVPAPLQDVKVHVRATFRYLADTARYVRDMADYLEQRHMDAVNQRLDNILGIVR